MAPDFTTPGVFIEEMPSFPGSIAQVETAVPAFIGYTEKAGTSGDSLLHIPVRISSLLDYIRHFGEDYRQVVSTSSETSYLLYRSLKLFFDNGGGDCYIVSVGTYSDTGIVIVLRDDLIGAAVGGFRALLDGATPTMIIIPDALILEVDSCYQVYRHMLDHCGDMQDRIAILDIHRDGTQDPILHFRERIGSDFLSYGVAYYPWLHTNIVSPTSIGIRHIVGDLKAHLDVGDTEALGMVEAHLAEMDAVVSEFERLQPEQYTASLKKDMAFNMDTFGVSEDGFLTAFAKAKKEINAHVLPEVIRLKVGGHWCDLPEFYKRLRAFITEREVALHKALLLASLTYKKRITHLTALHNVLPPSGAMAGVFTRVDGSRGVWKAPANIALNSVIKPAINITDIDQESLNVDPISGKSVNAIRSFTGKGVLVWGARTLDGNSNDWRYIPVRRTVIMVEQSIKNGLASFVFEPNDQNTWVRVEQMISNYLNNLWRMGGLAGARVDEAYSVRVGLGKTMTAQDIIEKKMIVNVLLAVVRPAEFTIINLVLEMQTS